MRQFAHTLLPALLLILTGPALAQSTHALNDGLVQFQVPSGWQMIMEKADGEPQAMIFQAPLSNADALDDAATATVKTRRLANAIAFDAFIAEEAVRASNLEDYHRDEQSGSNPHIFTSQRGTHRVRTVDTFVRLDGVGVKVRCQQPIAGNDWSNTFEASCVQLAASLQGTP